MSKCNGNTEILLFPFKVRIHVHLFSNRRGGPVQKNAQILRLASSIRIRWNVGGSKQTIFHQKVSSCGFRGHSRSGLRFQRGRSSQTTAQGWQDPFFQELYTSCHWWDVNVWGGFQVSRRHGRTVQVTVYPVRCLPEPSRRSSQGNLLRSPSVATHRAQIRHGFRCIRSNCVQ